MSTFRIAAIWLAFAAALGATSIQDTIYTPFVGEFFNGTVTIDCPQTTSHAGQPIARSRQTVTVVNGAFAISIQPYDTANPPNTCTVTYRSLDNTGAPLSWAERWFIPTTNNVLSIADVATPAFGPHPSFPWDSLTNSWDSYTGSWDSYR